MRRIKKRAARRNYVYDGDLAVINFSNDGYRGLSPDGSKLLMDCIRAGFNCPDDMLSDEELYDAAGQLVRAGFVELVMHFGKDHVGVITNMRNPMTGEVFETRYARAVEITVAN